MATVTRSTKVSGGTTLVASTLARASDVETDMLTLFTAHNNHDAGTSKWTVVSAEGATTVPLTVNNSTGTQNIAEFKDNGTTVLSVADGGTTAAAAIGNATALTATAANGGTGKALIANNGTSTGNILEAQDNGTACVTVADGGTVTLAPGGTTKVVANSSGLTLSNSATIAMGSAKITGLAAGTTSGDALMYAQLAPGIIKQIVSTVGFAGNSVTSATLTDVTGASASITPGATTSKVLVVATISTAMGTAAKAFNLTVLRGASNLFDATEGWHRCVSAAANAPYTEVIFYIDSPSSTSSLTYKLQGRSQDGATTFYMGNFAGSSCNNLYLFELGQ